MGGGMTHHHRCLCASVYSIKADSVESAFFRVFFIMCPHHDACPCIPSLPVKVETQDFASHKRVFRNISARFYGCENLLSLLVRRKILRLYRLAPLLWYYVTDAWNDILYIIIYNICCIDFTTFTVLYRCPISLASVVFKYTSLLSPSIRQSFISLARTFL